MEEILLQDLKEVVSKIWTNILREINKGKKHFKDWDHWDLKIKYVFEKQLLPRYLEKIADVNYGMVYGGMDVDTAQASFSRSVIAKFDAERAEVKDRYHQQISIIKETKSKNRARRITIICAIAGFISATCTIAINFGKIEKLGGDLLKAIINRG